ncbi:MAG: type II toxin-antitoxin system HicA family toxin [Dehalococcoidia bacterium]
MKDGLCLERQSGSHRQYLDLDKRRVTISFPHLGDTFTGRTLKSMIEKQAN